MLTTHRSRRRHAVAPATTAALATLSLVGSTRAGAAPEVTPDSVLLDRHQPIVVFHPAEPFRPTKVQSFVEDSELERFIGTSSSQLPLDAFWSVVDPDPEPGGLPGNSPGTFYRLDQVGCSAAALLAGRSCYANAWAEGAGGRAVYGRVVRTENRVLLQYWLFYYDNPLLLPPTVVGNFSQSHAGAVVGPPGSGTEHATIHRIEGAPWSGFGGRWGESEYFFTPIPLGPIPAGAAPVGLAPASPANQANWNIQTILGWPVAP